MPHTSRTDLDRGTCDGTRDLLVDRVAVHESLLVLGRTDEGNEVTALTAGSGSKPAS
ncbi:hypothetical protein [Streptomyces sp. UG1]|uniref:hypothetical protein n=1 Tax=Streptomyces sp. UG1 TaxID=3417652 RepID=UPI003CF07D50